MFIPKGLSILILLFWFCSVCYSQTVLLSTFPSVTLKIDLENSDNAVFDSVRIKMILWNETDSIQVLLFDRPVGRNYPWGTMGIIIKDQVPDTLTALINREMLSSTLYSESDLKKTGAFYKLMPGERLRQTFFLSDLVILKNYETILKPGRYHLFLNYYGKLSNALTFTLGNH